jgi:plasmid maintenance system antidote protein VapI
MKRIPSPPVTAEMASYIKLMREAGLYVHQIAQALHINQGRVSEVITGKRFPKQSAAVQLPFDFD